MAKPKVLYICSACGGQVLKWQGQCPHCREWNSLTEVVQEKSFSHFISDSAQGRVLSLRDVNAEDVPRFLTGLPEFDRVLGGGLVQGGVVLLGGDPGIGKSTLLLQALSRMSEHHRVLYVSGEESMQQVALRAKRLALDAAKVDLLAEIRLEAIQSVLVEHHPRVAIIDSIQTIYSETLQSAPGSVAQVRECAARLTRFAKPAVPVLCW